MTPIGSTIQPLQGSYLLPTFENARVYDAMRMGVFSCPPEASLKEVARMMASYHIHCVVVTEIDGDRAGTERRWGVLSDMDLARSAGVDAEDLSAGSVAATEVVTVPAEETLENAVRLMVEHDTPHLVVVQAATGMPVGVLSTLDLAGVLAWGEG